jgi:hypothetical protein
MDFLANVTPYKLYGGPILGRFGLIWGPTIRFVWGLYCRLRGQPLDNYWCTISYDIRLTVLRISMTKNGFRALHAAAPVQQGPRPCVPLRGLLRLLRVSCLAVWWVCGSVSTGLCWLTHLPIAPVAL